METSVRTQVGRWASSKPDRSREPQSNKERNPPSLKVRGLIAEEKDEDDDDDGASAFAFAFAFAIWNRTFTAFPALRYAMTNTW